MLRHATLRARLMAESSVRTACRHRQTLAAMGDTAREAHESLRRMSRSHDSFSNGRLMHICKLARQDGDEAALRAVKGSMALYDNKKVALTDHAMCNAIRTLVAVGGADGYDTAFELLRRGDHALRATPSTISALLRAAAMHGKADGVRQAIGWLKLHHKRDISTTHYRSAIAACAKAEKPGTAYKLFEDACNAGIRLPAHSYTAVAALHAEDADKLQAIVEAARAAGGANASLEKLAAAAPPAAVGDDGDAAQPEGEGEQAKEEKA